MAIGDSSPADDGTGAAGENLFDGWGEGGDALQYLRRGELFAGGKIRIAEIAGQIAARSPYEYGGRTRVEAFSLDGMENLGDTEEG